MILQGQPNKINLNRMVLGRRKKSKSAVQILNDSDVELSLDFVWRGSTDDATATQLYLNDDGVSVFPINEDQGVILECIVMCKQESSVNVSGWKHKTSFYRNDTGNITEKIYYSEVIASDLAVTFEFKIDNADFYIYPEVTGIAATDLKWQIVGRVNQL